MLCEIQPSSLQPAVQTADVTTGIMIAVAIGALILGRLLVGKQKNKNEFDNSVASFASRNAPIPYLIGRRRVGATVVSVWNRTAEEISTGGGGKGIFGGGGGGTKQTIYYENAVHAIACGQGTALRGIYQDGEAIWTGAATPDVDGKYSEDLGDEGAFTIWFGTDSTVKTLHRTSGTGEPLFNNTGKGIIWIEWTKKKLGGSATWPQLEYDLEAMDSSRSLLVGSAYEVVSTAADADADLDRGVNLAHAVFQILTAEHPFGCGFQPTEIDNTTLEALGVQMESEEIGVNLLMKGQTGADVMSDLMLVGGFYLVERQARLFFIMIREASAAPAIGESILAAPRSAFRVVTDEISPTRVLMNFPDIRQNYRTNNPMSIDNDGSASRYETYRVEEVTTEAVTSHFMMATVGRRKLAEAFGDRQSRRVVAGRNAHLLLPGEPCTIDGVPMRVLASKPIITAGTAEMDLVFDSYGIGDVNDTPNPSGGGGGRKDVEADIAFTWFELPTDISGGAIQFAVMRVRAHQQVIGANILFAVDGGAYASVGRQDKYSAGGTLDDAIADTDGTGGEIASGPVVSFSNLDVNEYADDVLDDDSWRAGVRICAINGEVFYGPQELDLQVETAVARSTAYSLGDYVIPPTADATGLRYECVQAGTTGAGDVVYWPADPHADPITDGTVQWQARAFAYQMLGLVRAQMETVEENHAIGDDVFIIARSGLRALSHPPADVGTTLCVKSQPFTSTQTIDPTLVTAVCKEIRGVGLLGEALALNDDTLLALDVSTTQEEVLVLTVE